MTNEELNTALYKKVFAEQEKYREWLLSQPPDEILNHCYEYTVREDIVLALEEYDLSDKHCKALLKSPSPLADVFKDFEKVFEGEVECGTLEEVYQMFNLDHPDGYWGRSLSVSDVLEVVGEEKSTFHFCDSIGFREVDFDPDMTEPLKEKKIKVVLCEPGKVARVAEIGTELSDLQRVVGGLIEPYYPFEEQVCIVCNDEGKYNGMRPCRAIYGENREMMDIIFGPFFICDCSTPYFGSLNKEQLERYTKQFQNPEHFFRVGGEIKAVPYKPEKDHER